jgi:hypothetical protein
MTDQAISPLRRRMIEDMAIREFGAKTQHDYVQRVKDFAAFLGRSPAEASKEDVRRYQFHLSSSGAGKDGIYDPRHPNDRLLLGMEGTMSELEFSLFRQRSQEALRQMARRGALVLTVAAGYVKVGRDRIEKNPDRRVQEAIQLVFTKFAEFQSARQVHIWLRHKGIELPVKSRRGEAHGVVWRLPAYNIVHNILTNPIYAGAYAFGRTTSLISVVDGRKRVRRGVHRPMDKWDVLIKDHHAAYITWDEFERNLKAIANNATRMSSALTRGAAREGELLLSGLLRCGHCGRKLHVHYGGKLGRYNCYGALKNQGTIPAFGVRVERSRRGRVFRDRSQRWK